MRATALLLLCSCSIAAAQAPSLPDREEAAYPAIERFVTVLELVRKRHPDVDRLAYDRLVNRALEGMMSSLDPHSSFIHPGMAEAMKDTDFDPHVPSLGFTFGVREGKPYFAGIDTHGSAAEAAIPQGSEILAIDGTACADVEPAKLVGSLMRPPGTKSVFQIQSAGEPKPREIPLVHRVVEEKAVTESTMLPNPERKIGYLRLAQFTPTCSQEMEAALDDLEDKGMKELIFDLRGNPGGDLQETVKLLGLFVPPKTPMVTVRSRNGDEPPLRTPDRQRRKRDYPIAVLIDRNSASASELTSGALQDLKRATVIGETSYGKGSVQQIIPESGGTAVRVTIATYHTPSGRTPHRIGITPDVPVAISGTDRENFDLFRRKESLTPEEKQKLAGWKDPVLEAAQKALAK